jgi:hypothetical protein
MAVLTVILCYCNLFGFNASKLERLHHRSNQPQGAPAAIISNVSIGHPAIVLQ